MATSSDLQSLKDRLTVKLLRMGIFKAEAIMEAIHTFFNFGFEPTYFTLHDEHRIGEHVYGYLCALVAPTEGGDDASRNGFHFYSEHAQYAYYLCRNEEPCIRRTEARIEAYLERVLEDESLAVSVRTFTSKEAPPKGTGGALVVLYAIERSPFQPLPAPSTGKVPKADWSVKTLATDRFISSRSTASVARYDKLFGQLRDSFAPVEYRVEHNAERNQIGFQLAFMPDRASYFTSLTVLMHSLGDKAVVTKKFLETFRNGIQVYSFYFRDVDPGDLERIGSTMGQLPNRNLLRPVTDLFLQKLLSPQETLFATALVQFAFYFTPVPHSDDFTTLMHTLQHDTASTRKLKALRDDMFRELMSEQYVCSVLVRHLDAFRVLFNDFAAGSTPQSREKLRESISRAVSNKTERDVFHTFAKFNAAVKRTNFFRTGAAAISFRLDPSFIADLDYPRVPYAVYMVVGAHFRGFHVRFADIARGGIRIITSRGETPADVERAYRRNKTFLFNENYNLAHTQMLKNKDIPESGSKGTILVSTRAAPDGHLQLYLQYVDALLDLMVPGVSGVRDYMDAKEEILFLGPDEGTAGAYPSIAAAHGKRRGYAHWKSFTTGKGPDVGGVPHDTYGMTTRSVRSYCQGLYRKLGLDETKLTKFMTGGPDGDLGSNEILMGQERVVGICDGFASVHDPDGIQREELVRLAKGRKSLREFDTSKLSARGFHVAVTDRNKALPDGTVVADGTAFRNAFHFTAYADADIMVPCGGRPASVSLDTVHQMLRNATGVTADSMLSGKSGVSPSQLRFKFIVEGANLFFTQDARIALEKCGVHLFKDSSTNKGGVTSSSLEVLAGLALTDAEHREHMCVPKGETPPKFYQTYVRETCDRIEANAAREFECIWRESERRYLGGSKTLISDALSVKINTIKTFVQSSDLHHDSRLFRYVISRYVLPVTLEKVPLSDIMQRVPKAYLVAIFSIYIASNFVYTTGLESANEFSFFQFMHRLHAEAAAVEPGASKL